MKKKTNSKKIKINQRNEDRKDALAKRYALETAGQIYQAWKLRLTSGRVRAEELAERVNELASELIQRVKHPEVLEATITMVDMKLGDIYLAMKTGMLHLKVHVICPNEVKVNAETMVCNLAFDTLVSRANWSEGKVRIQCPSCGGLIHQKNMKPVVIKIEEN